MDRTTALRAKAARLGLGTLISAGIGVSGMPAAGAAADPWSDCVSQAAAAPAHDVICVQGDKGTVVKLHEEPGHQGSAFAHNVALPAGEEVVKVDNPTSAILHLGPGDTRDAASNGARGWEQVVLPGKDIAILPLDSYYYYDY